MPTNVLLEVDADGVALITLSGEATLNAFSGHTAAQLGAAYARCDADDGIRAVVITGAGRAFCSGADLTEAAASFGPPGDDFSASPIQPPAFRVRKLVIAALNGPVIGIGLTLALQCDVRLVAQDATLAIPQVRRGMLGDCQSHYTLRQAVGLAVAAELLLTGRSLTGEEAVAKGICSRALASAEVLPAALELAREVAATANPASVALSKRLLWADLDADSVARAETGAHRALLSGPDALEGAAAWREKRAPQWQTRASEVLDPA